jgi:hypothetical protein
VIGGSNAKRLVGTIADMGKRVNRSHAVAGLSQRSQWTHSSLFYRASSVSWIPLFLWCSGAWTQPASAHSPPTATSRAHQQIYH